MTEEEKAKILVHYERQMRETIERHKRVLRAMKEPPAWEVGIPVEEAEAWVRKYYKVGEEGKAP